jgi:hypothetical protein
MFDMGTQLDALRQALSCLEDAEGVLFALAAVVVLWMAHHDWVSLTTIRHH